MKVSCSTQFPCVGLWLPEELANSPTIQAFMKKNGTWGSWNDVFLWWNGDAIEENSFGVPPALWKAIEEAVTEQGLYGDECYVHIKNA